MTKTHRFSQILNPWHWFTKADHNSAAQVELSLRHIQLLMTKTGIFFLLVLFITLIGAINYAVNLAYFLVFMLCALFILSLFYCLTNLQGLKFRASATTPIYAGDPALFPIHISGLPNKHYYSVMLSFINQEATYVDLAPADDHLINLQLPSSRRGWLELPEIHIETRYPLSLFKAWSRIYLQQKIMVYPKPISPGWLPAFDGHNDSAGKEKLAELGDFHGLKTYCESDNPKRIAWKIYAQGRGLYCKQFTEPTGDAMIFKWEHVSYLPIEQALSHLCFWLLEAHQNRLEYGLELPKKTIALGKSETHLRHCLQTLALFQNSP